MPRRNNPRRTPQRSKAGGPRFIVTTGGKRIHLHNVSAFWASVAEGIKSLDEVAR